MILLYFNRIYIYQAKTTDISSSPNDAPPKAKEVLEAPVVEISEEDIKARRAYYKRIEALSAEVVRKASEAADRVLEERRQMECETLITIEEAVALSAQSESTEISADIHANEDNENDSYVVAPIQVPETMIFQSMMTRRGTNAARPVVSRSSASIND